MNYIFNVIRGPLLSVFPQIIAGADYYFFRTKMGRLFEGRRLFPTLGLHVTSETFPVAVIAVDPITIPDEHFSSECLPPVEATDLLSYLVLETSFYTKQLFKAYNSLEAYNLMVSGFITSVQGCVVREKYIVTGKVRHSQRMNNP